jgi:hypothetical protein
MERNCDLRRHLWQGSVTHPRFCVMCYYGHFTRGRATGVWKWSRTVLQQRGTKYTKFIFCVHYTHPLCNASAPWYLVHFEFTTNVSQPYKYVLIYTEIKAGALNGSWPNHKTSHTVCRVVQSHSKPTRMKYSQPSKIWILTCKMLVFI